MPEHCKPDPMSEFGKHGQSFLNMADLHHFILENIGEFIINIAGMAQNEVFVSSPELLALIFG